MSSILDNSTVLLHVIERTYLVTGRLYGDDDDAVHLIEADSIGDAETIFTKQIIIDSDREKECEVIITASKSLLSALDQRLK